MVTVAAIGEVMIELSPSPASSEHNRELLALGYAGDSFNTAVYLSRLGIKTDYITQLGDDYYSDKVLNYLAREKIGTSLIRQVPETRPGLYLIRNSVDGERAFYYWRNQSPARKIFSDIEHRQALFKQLMQFDYLYLTGISLAIIEPGDRTSVFEFLQRYREGGGKVIFDSNYRPGLWSDKEVTQSTINTAMNYTDIALLTLDDEQLLWDIESADDCLALHSQRSVPEIVIKRGRRSVIAKLEGRQVEIEVPTVNNIVDTTGAGDTFNAGYLAGRLKGLTVEDSIALANKCAAQTIQYRGAIIDSERFEQCINLNYAAELESPCRKFREAEPN